MKNITEKMRDKGLQEVDSKNNKKWHSESNVIFDAKSKSDLKTFYHVRIWMHKN